MGEDVTAEDSESSGSRLAKGPTRRSLFQSPEREAAPFCAVAAAAKTSASGVVSPPGQRGQYNCPIGLYSAQTLREMALMQGKLGEGVSLAPSEPSLPG